MSVLRIEKFSDTAIRISNLELLPQRFQSKLRLFLKSAFTSVHVIEGEKEIIVDYPVWDNYVLGKDLIRIVEFVTSSVIEYDCDIAIQKVIKDYSENIEASKLRSELLYSIKTSNFQNTDEFKNYKTFCDNNLKITLRDYQYESSYLLSMSKAGFDFSVPGSGKTIITYASYCYFKHNDDIKKILVIGPKNAYNAWLDEYKTCFGESPDFENLSNQNLNYAKSYFLASSSNHKEVSFINIDKIRNLQKEMSSFLATEKCLLVIDEGHKVKNPSAKATQVALELSKYVQYKILLTGTPMPNGYEDLSALATILSPSHEILPYNYSQLRSFTMNGISDEQEKQIMDAVFPHYSRVSKKYLVERKELLPPKPNFSFVEMNSEQKEIYDFLNELAADIYNHWELEFSFVMMKAIMIRKMQASANPKLLNKSLLSVYENIKSELFNYDEEYELNSEQYESELKELGLAGEIIDREIAASRVGSIIKDYNRGKYIIQKNQRAVDITKELLSENKKVILWDVFVENMRVLKDMISSQLNVSVGIINGSVVGEERQAVIDSFREEKLKVLIASPATLAESISLHKCCQNAIYVNRNYNAAQFIQSKNRIHRINMPEGTTATYNFLINIETIDEAINERLELKEARMLKILDAEDIVIGDLDCNDTSTMSKEDVEKSYLT